VRRTRSSPSMPCAASLGGVATMLARPMVAGASGGTPTARAAAQAINALPAFGGHGPFRFDETRHDYRFYVQKGVPYYRLTELAAPQAISQWYLGSGGAVGFHTITGWSALNHLLDLREKGEVRFKVWPHETLTPEGNTLIESYPGLCPTLDTYGPCHGDDEEDAWKVLQFLVVAQQAGQLAGLFDLRPLPFGRAEGVEFQRQVPVRGIHHRPERVRCDALMDMTQTDPIPQRNGWCRSLAR
jgi:hypothetical protein